MKTTSLSYKTAQVDSLKIFYREAGDPQASAILLLHGFPTSSHMFRNLIPELVGQHHVIAPEGYRRDNPSAKVIFYDTGHFALETHAAEIGAEIRAFLGAIDKS